MKKNNDAWLTTINPGHFSLISGIGYSTGGSNGNLLAFDAALRDAGVGNYNLVQIGQILPPNVELTDNFADLEAGALVPSAISVVYSHARYQAFGAAVAVGIPKDKSQVGVILTSSFSSGARSRLALAEADLRELLPAWQNQLQRDVDEVMKARRIEREDILVKAVADFSCELRQTLRLDADEINPVTALVAAVCLW